MSITAQWFSGENLKTKRKASSLSRTKLAAEIGVAATTLESWETGKATPRADSLGAACAVLGCPVDDLFVKVEVPR